MTLMQWLNMNLIVDIALTVFSAALVWRSVKLQNQIVELQEGLNLVTKNPQLAKRKLKEKEKQSIIS
tara:strand:- start:3513 stop:3713 length:201 start_codon:yes stop_codon:yes gene_type:complete